MLQVRRANLVCVEITGCLESPAKKVPVVTAVCQVNRVSMVYQVSFLHTQQFYILPPHPMAMDDLIRLQVS